MTSELLQQVRVLDPTTNTDRVADVLIENGAIAAVESAIAQWSADTQVRSGQGLILGPGLVDLYSHSGEPGFESRETLASLAQGAIAGGFTRVTLLPDTQPALDQRDAIAALQRRCDALGVQFQVWGALTLGLKGLQMTELAELAAETSVVGFADGQPLNNLMLIQRVLEYAEPLGKPVGLWPCEGALDGGVAREGTHALRLGLASSPVAAETAALSSLLACIAATATPVHFLRISTAGSVQILRQAKAQGLPVTASVSWLHLLRNTTHLESYDPNLRLAPPLGNPEDMEALRQGLLDGTLDAIAIDHAAYTYEEKTVAFAEAPPGSIGLELALPLLWQALVEEAGWSPLTLWRCLSSQPARCLGQTLGAIAPGQPAELTLFDPRQSWDVTEACLRSLSGNTAWLHQTLQGRVLQTWCPRQ